MSKGKIYSITVERGRIKEVSVYIGETNKYDGLVGFNPPRTVYNIGEFTGEKAINTILEDIGVKDISLDISKANYWEYGVLNKLLAHNARIKINGNTFMNPIKTMAEIKKVTLNENGSISKIKLDATIDINYEEYLIMYSIWCDYVDEDTLVDNLKKTFIVETHDGRAYNYYAKYETEDSIVVRDVSSRDGFTCKGVFLVNMKDTLLKFKAIEESFSYSCNEIVTKESVFYISKDSINYMK